MSPAFGGEAAEGAALATTASLAKGGGDSSSVLDGGTAAPICFTDGAAGVDEDCPSSNREPRRGAGAAVNSIDEETPCMEWVASGKVGASTLACAVIGAADSVGAAISVVMAKSCAESCAAVLSLLSPSSRVQS